MSYSVGQVAAFAGVTVRTLHHYDEIGLLSPGDRSAAGYRRYADADLERLQQILVYRQLGFPLDEIAAIIDDPDADPLSHLRRQHDLLSDRMHRIKAMIGAVEQAMEASKMGISLTPEERFEVFGDNDPAQYADEAQQRWGESDVYRESARRTKSYTKADWLTIKAEGGEVGALMVAAMNSGAPPTSAAAMAAAEAHRQHISRWFYDCSPAMHRNLAAMYITDPRFTATYEQQAEGLAQYTHDAIMANAG